MGGQPAPQDGKHHRTAPRPDPYPLSVVITQITLVHYDAFCYDGFTKTPLQESRHAQKASDAFRFRGNRDPYS